MHLLGKPVSTVQVWGMGPASQLLSYCIWSAPPGRHGTGAKGKHEDVEVWVLPLASRAQEMAEVGFEPRPSNAGASITQYWLLYLYPLPSFHLFSSFPSSFHPSVFFHAFMRHQSGARLCARQRGRSCEPGSHGAHPGGFLCQPLAALCTRDLRTAPGWPGWPSWVGSSFTSCEGPSVGGGGWVKGSAALDKAGVVTLALFARTPWPHSHR